MWRPYLEFPLSRQMTAGRANLNQTTQHYPSLTPPPPLSSSSLQSLSTWELPPSHLDRAWVRPARREWTKGDSPAGRSTQRTSTRVVPLLSPTAVQLLVHVRLVRCVCVWVCVHRSPNLSSCVWFCIHVVWGLLSCWVFFFPLCVLTPCSVWWRHVLVKLWMWAASCQRHCFNIWIYSQCDR